ncbi:MAG TPA: hypothetical protein VKM93_07600 [Terriglobia bacterium]|nr:hypothetical protein [Terriglobia bacterium]
MKITKIVATTMVVLSTLTLGLRAEDNPKPREAKTPLVVQVVFTEYDGEKKVSSLPYTLNVVSSKSSGSPGNSERVSLRMGLRVPIMVGGSDKSGVSSFQYQDVGTDIDCTAYPVEGAMFNLVLRVQRSSLYESGVKTNAVPEIAQQPIFSHFSSDLSLDMRDGQTIQSTMATDPISGHVLKVDVTLHVAKQ